MTMAEIAMETATTIALPSAGMAAMIMVEIVTATETTTDSPRGGMEAMTVVVTETATATVTTTTTVLQKESADQGEVEEEVTAAREAGEIAAQEVEEDRVLTNFSSRGNEETMSLYKLPLCCVLILKLFRLSPSPSK